MKEARSLLRAETSVQSLNALTMVLVFLLMIIALVTPIRESALPELVRGEEQDLTFSLMLFGLTGAFILLFGVMGLISVVICLYAPSQRPPGSPK